MKKHILKIAAIAALVALQVHAEVTLTPEDVEGSACFRLDNGRVALVVDPSRGGAVISYKDKLGGDVELISAKPPRGLCHDHIQSQGWPGEMFDAHQIMGRSRGAINYAKKSQYSKNA
ncbi:MAG: hypothetical protein L6437_02845 [Kiritimatiellae bacterium]|nr:hypothetical protein [Kiritimatiellia bacterium]